MHIFFHQEDLDPLYIIYKAGVFWLPLLQVTVSQRAIDELVGCPLQGEVIPSLMEGQVTTQHLHVLLLSWETEEEGGKT